MITSINFDDEFEGKADKIDYVLRNYVFSAKSYS